MLVAKQKQSLVKHARDGIHNILMHMFNLFQAIIIAEIQTENLRFGAIQQTQT